MILNVCNFDMYIRVGYTLKIKIITMVEWYSLGKIYEAERRRPALPAFFRSKIETN